MAETDPPPGLHGSRTGNGSGTGPMTEDFEFGQYVHAFTSSSNRVRYVIFTIIVTSILVFAGHRVANPKSWINSTIDLGRTALRCQVWTTESQAMIARCKDHLPLTESPAGCTDCERAALAVKWANAQVLSTEEQVRGKLAQLEEARVEKVGIMQMPFLGITFDVNDLGLLSAIAFIVLMITLALSASRQHENHFLTTWKIMEIADAEQRPDDGGSKANLLYHAVAMAQLFTTPPTLARWRTRRFYGLCTRLLFALPLFVQGMVLVHDWRTGDIGFLLNPVRTWVALAIESAAMVVIACAAVVVWLYTGASQRRWKRAFFKVNPGYATKEQPRWWTAMSRPLLNLAE